MLKYIHGEIYRLLHKKSSYIYFGVVALGYLFLMYMRSGGFTQESIVDDAMNFFFFLPVIVGGFLFSAIYTDDLNSRNLISLVGFGIGKTKIVVSKFILVTILNLVVFAVIPLLHCGIFYVLGWSTDAQQWTMIYALALKFLLMTVAFSLLSGIVVYGVQRTTFAIVAYVLLAFNIVSGLLSAGLKTFAPNLTNYLISGITDGIMLGIVEAKLPVVAIIEFLIYATIALVISVIAFNRKEMEF